MDVMWLVYACAHTGAPPLLADGWPHDDVHFDWTVLVTLVRALLFYLKCMPVLPQVK